MTSIDIQRYEMAKSLIQQINEIKNKMELPIVSTKEPINPNVSLGHWSDDIADATQKLNHRVDGAFRGAIMELESIIEKI